MTAVTSTPVPRRDDGTEASVHARAVTLVEAPVGRTTGWWGMLLFIATEGATFAAFIGSYFYLRFSDARTWPPPADTLPHLVAPSIGTGVLVLSCVPMLVASRRARERRNAVTGIALLVTLLCGVAFLVLQLVDYGQEYPSSTLQKDAYGSLLYTITGLHGVHVAIGLVMLLVVLVGLVARRREGGRAGAVRVVAMYWYFLSVLAVAIYVTVYLSPRM